MNESELRSLYEWIDIQQHNSGGVRAGILGGTIGGGAALFGALIPILLVIFHLSAAIAVTVPIISWLVISLAVLTWFFFARNPEEKQLARTVAEMRRIWFRLVLSRWSRNVAGLLGEENARALDEAAKQFLRTRSALRSPAWSSVRADSPYFKTRKSAGVGMETAMARLVTLVGQGTSLTDGEVKSLMDAMHHTADEVESMTGRLANHRGLPKDASESLRQTLREMQALNEADDEVSQIQKGL